MSKKISVFGIVAVSIYFVFVFLFLITKNELILTIWELLIIGGAFADLLIIVKLLDTYKIKGNNRTLAIGFMISCVVLSSVAHFVNICVTRKLMASEVFIPTYYQIGYYPSFEMAIDNLGWGLFMGLSFLFVYLGIKKDKLIKNILLICTLLCFIGFVGYFFINENLWYFAPMAYGVGIIVICIIFLIRKPILNEIIEK